MVLWDVATRKRLLEDPLPVKEGGVHSVAFSPDGKTIAAGYAGGDGGGVVLWDVATRKRLLEDPLPVKEGGVHSVALSPDGKTLAAGYGARRRRRCGAVGRGHTQTPPEDQDPLPVKGGYLESVAFSPDGKTLAAGYGPAVWSCGTWPPANASWRIPSP